VRGARIVSAHFFIVVLDGVSDKCCALAALYPPGKDLWYPLDRRLGGAQSQSGCRG
jgi:hypothetical protein